MSTPHDENLYLMLGEMKGMLQTLVQSHQDMKEHNEKVQSGTEERLNSHSARIRDLENHKWKMIGIMTVIAVVVPIILSAVIGVYIN